MATDESSTSPIEQPDTKRCTKCKQEKPLRAFNKNCSRLDGLQHRCRDCIKKYYNENKDKILGSHREYYYRTNDIQKEKAAKRRGTPEYKAYIVKYRKEYYVENAEELREYQKDYLSNPENKAKVNERQRQYDQNHKEERLEYQKIYNRKNPEKITTRQRRYHRENPQVARVSGQKRRARIKGLPDTFRTIHADFALNYWEYQCAICGRSEALLWRIIFDHWHPLSSQNSPGTAPENMLPLCHNVNGTRGMNAPGCNQLKWSHDPVAWLGKRFGPRKAKAKLKEIAAFFIAAQAFSMQGANGAD